MKDAIQAGTIEVAARSGTAIEAHLAQPLLRRPAAGPATRVAVELTAESALALVDAIRAALAAVPAELTG